MVRLTSAALALALLVPAALSAQDTDLTGTWILSVTVTGNVTTPRMVLVQSADSLSGTYTSETLGEAQIRGTVNGSDLRISFTAQMQGQPIPVRYSGSVQEDGTLKGTVDLASGTITGTFTARRADGFPGVGRLR